MQRVDVSVIIPTYKGLENIGISIDSVLRQKDVHCEIIVVDDNGVGTEEQLNTRKILDKYIANNEIRYVCHEVNQGGSAARNTGASVAQAPYVLFLDDDDVLLPVMLKKQVNVLERSNDDVAMAVCGGYYAHENGVGYQRLIMDSRNQLYDYLMDRFYFNTSAILVKKSVFEHINGFDDKFERHQDWEFCVRILADYKAVIVNEALFIRYFGERNTPKTIDKTSALLKYFFSRMGPLMKKSLGKENYNNVRCHKYADVAIQYYIMSMKPIKAIQYLKKHKCGWKGIGYLMTGTMKRFFDKLFKGSKKVTYSRDELIEILKNN